MANTEDLRYVEKLDSYLDLVHSVFCKYFEDKGAFLSFYCAIQTKEEKNLFLRVGSFYKFLIVDGKFTFSDEVLDSGMGYINESYKFMGIFSLIESIYGKEKHIDFYNYIIRKKSKIKFPINDRGELDSMYEEYKKEFGAIKNAIKFLTKLDNDTHELIQSKLRIKNQESSIKELVNLLYTMRSEFVHNSKFVLSFSDKICISKHKNKLIINDLTLEDLRVIFENGFLNHFRGH